MISEGNVEAAVETASTPRHIALVRITHWIVVLSVLGLLVSGTGILVSHPRLYWGETGAVGTPSLIDLPIPFIIGPSVWNRPFHFFFAWVLVLTGLSYVVGRFISLVLFCCCFLSSCISSCCALLDSGAVCGQ